MLYILICIWSQNYAVLANKSSYVLRLSNVVIIGILTIQQLFPVYYIVIHFCACYGLITLNVVLT